LKISEKKSLILLKRPKNIIRIKMIKNKSAIEEFNNWAKIGKDVGMENGHANSVSQMINIFEKRFDVNNVKSMLDLGCGNGWMLRKLASKYSLDVGLGIDGSAEMINKAKKYQTNLDYLCMDITKWKASRSYDLIMSMEFIYYLNDPETVFNNIFNNAAHKESIFIFGIDHYKENQDSLSWPSDLGVYMNTLSINEWIDLYRKIGMKDIEYEQFVTKEDSEGTLIISGIK